MFNNILFPTDTSEKSNSGFEYAVDLMHNYHGKITLLNVHEEFMNRDEMQLLRISTIDYQEFIRIRALDSRRIMERLISDAGIEKQATILLREGNPRQEILSVADEIDADVIVMTSNGRSNIKEHLIGSVAEHIVRFSKRPVLVIK